MGLAIMDTDPPRLAGRRRPSAQTSTKAGALQIYFSILARKALTPSHFGDLTELAERIPGFQDEFEEHAQPFDWRFIRRHLDALLARLDAGQQPRAA
jgi:hypothetical protein